MLVSSFLKVGVCCVSVFGFSSYALGDLVSWEVSVPLPETIVAIPEQVIPASLSFDSTPLVASATDEEFDDEKARLSVEKPTKTPIVLDDGRFIVTSVESYSVGKIDNRTSCSFIARNNIQQLLAAMGLITTDTLPRWDAKDLIEKGMLWNTVQPFEKPEHLIEAIDARNRDFFETVFDAYRYVPSRSPEIQFHRITLFLGDDGAWYILDPADGQMTIEPQDFKSYMEQWPKNAQWFLRTQWYSKLNIISADVFQRFMAYLSPELHGFYQDQYLEVPRRLRVVEFS
jgi:hypothetical protein